jgi:long-subunit fatty acid transport protein
MKSGYFALAILFASSLSFAQNDIDALRYSQTGVGGTARFISMGGAFGALGGNTSCLSYNPAGIGIYRKGELNITPGVNFTSVKSTHNSKETKDFTPALVLNGFGIAGSWDSHNNQDVRHSLGISLNQLQNFNSSTSVQGRANGNSIMQDILDNAGGNSITNLDPSYSGLAYSTYLLDTINGSYYGFIDPKKNMLQTKNIIHSGKMNEIAIGYAYSFKDKLYLGASLGIPIVSYNHNSLYTESDDKDSLRIFRDASNNVQSTYSYPVWAYNNFDNNGLLGGFNSMSYNEVYKTTGRGYNLKLGAIYRVNEYLRLGANYQTPTVLNLTDVYSYSMTTVFDGGDDVSASYPENGGIYKYKIITPMRYGASIGFIYRKLLAIGIDYESVNYGQANITSAEPSYFSGVNKTISKKYSQTSNLRVGAEVNIENVFVRTGYAMYGSPFGNTFSGKFTRTTYSGGLGFRNKNWAFDIGFVRSMYDEDYFMYNSDYVNKTDISVSNTNFVATVGCKF